MSLAQRMYFLQDVFQMTAIALVSMGGIYFETLSIYMCVCERERERERKKVCVRVYECVYVCVHTGL